MFIRIIVVFTRFARCAFLRGTRFPMMVKVASTAATIIIVVLIILIVMVVVIMIVIVVFHPFDFFFSHGRHQVNQTHGLRSTGPLAI